MEEKSRSGLYVNEKLPVNSCFRLRHTTCIQRGNSSGVCQGPGYALFNESMVIQFEPLRKRLLRADAVRRRNYVAKVKATYGEWTAGRIPLTRLCSDAGDALQDYASETLDALVGSANGNRDPEEPASWVLDAYHEGISRAGVAMRDAIADSNARHAVAQTLQERMLRAEACLRQVIESSQTARPQH
jgi:hypothetical protein